MARLACFLFVLAAAISVTPVDGQEVADKRPTKIWNLTGPLGETPKRVTDAYPLSDQDNKGGWVKFEPMSDEFDGQELDLNKWNRGMYWWKGRQPALFSDKNVSVLDGKLHLTMRKEQVPEEFEKLGYKDYTSAALHTKVRSSYGYYEVKAKPMNSGGSSSFWFQQDELPGWATEIDVFEIGGNAKGFEHKYHMTLHVSGTPTEKKHWSLGGVWEAPWRFADDYHVFGLDWGPKLEPAKAIEAKPTKVGDVITIAQVRAVAELVTLVGGFERCHELLGVIRDVGGLKRMKDLLEALAAAQVGPSKA